MIEAEAFVRNRQQIAAGRVQKPGDSGKVRDQIRLMFDGVTAYNDIEGLGDHADVTGCRDVIDVGTSARIHAVGARFVLEGISVDDVKILDVGSRNRRASQWTDFENGFSTCGKRKKRRAVADGRTQSPVVFTAVAVVSFQVNVRYVAQVGIMLA